jgi:hypothetical protein
MFVSLCALVEQSVTLATAALNSPQSQTADPAPRQTRQGTSWSVVYTTYLVAKHNEFLRLETRNKKPEHKELPIILTQLGFFLQPYTRATTPKYPHFQPLLGR